LLWLITFTWQI
jgi:hypothetical protein